MAASTELMRLSLTHIVVKFSRSPMPLGKAPENLLLKSSSVCRREKFPKHGGSAPVRLLLNSVSASSSVHWAIDTGSAPDRLLSAKFSTLSRVSLVKISGKDPDKLFSGSVIMMTLFAESQFSPYHPVFASQQSVLPQLCLRVQFGPCVEL